MKRDELVGCAVPAIVAAAFVGHGEANARAGDGRADVDGADVVLRGDHDMRVAALFEAFDLPDIGDDTREHEAVLTRDLIAFQDIGPELLAREKLQCRRFGKPALLQRSQRRPAARA